MRVVEPFLTGTSYSLNPVINYAEKLSKLINMDVWNSKLSSVHSYKPVLSWETFKKEAPKQIIIHCIQYRESGVSPRTRDFNGVQNGCSKECYKQFDPVLLLQQEGFKQIRRSCTNVLKLSLGHTVSFKEFKESIFARSDPANVTVIFNEFRGLDPHLGGVRLPLQLDSPCIHTRRLPPKIIVPSAEILSNAKKYYTKVAENFTVGILARIEKIHANHRLTFMKCVEKAVQTKEDLYKKRGLTNLFLAMDVGKYGSTSIGANQVLTQGQTLFNKLYTQENWTFQEREESFSSIASSDNVAYVANLQRTIAAKATCLILIGGGSFQEQTEEWHREQFHPELSNQCIYTICT